MTTPTNKRSDDEVLEEVLSWAPGILVNGKHTEYDIGVQEYMARIAGKLPELLKERPLQEVGGEPTPNQALIDLLWEKHCHESTGEQPDRMYYENFCDAAAEYEEDIRLLTEEIEHLREDLAKCDKRVEEAIANYQTEYEQKHIAAAVKVSKEVASQAINHQEK